MLDVSQKATWRIGSERSFGTMFALIAIGIGLEPLLRNHGPRLALLGLGGILFCLTLWKPEILAIPNKIWSGFGAVLGGVVSEFVMFTIYVMVFVPTSFVLRVLRRGPFHHKQAEPPETYWKVRGRDVPAMGKMTSQF